MTPLIAPAISGLLLGGSLIIAIGAQNAFILRQGLLRQHVFILCLICALSDAALIGLGVAGLGAIISGSDILIAVVTLGGAAFLAVYAFLALKRAIKPSGMEAARSAPGSLKAAVLTCLAFTFLNPHVYLDTVLLVGGLSGRYEGTARLAFAIGAMSASFLWFFGLGYGARVLEPLFLKPSAWRVLDGLIAAVMAALSVSLLVRFFAG
ncbi:LysE/ArgO family amino acid transporter [uncultured Hoeflea sp.]|uniref:LysE/ArgO family amino acid transporter n=1 Tax=uncultured Hoeflea sp. TaxID=538666 RepID=UPI0030EF07B8|tara:strand:- start:33519 stop:34142 length:624 start_codon:yes stop_codon:yes gene_type:complete